MASVVKNLVLIKFNPSADKSYLFEVPLESMVFAGEILMVENYVGQRQEVTAICDSFVVAGGAALERVCAVNGTKPENLKRAVGFVRKELTFYDFKDPVPVHPTCEEDDEDCDCDCDCDGWKVMEEDVAYEYNKCAYEVSKELAQVVAEACEELGIDCGKIVITISDEDDEESED